ncbi:hypothetical protein DICVIV_10830 [Dictyocaulus viviparus]|uniref:Uncharacterized protein n=1 Tax=Dictyocaulus viviparus TaxID=29172 RepID=A0A0D8XHF4_DICVI|nr:hypothetical protein DICVIV_10830 [Dictyocaulus viviparus]
MQTAENVEYIMKEFSDEYRICITPNTSTCHTWVNNQVHWIEQGLVYRSNDRICIAQIVWLMRSLAYLSLFTIGVLVNSRRRNAGITPNAVAFTCFVLVANISILLLNYYMENDWRQYWKSVKIYTFSNNIRHEPIAYLTLFLFIVQFVCFIDFFHQLYAKTWSHW